MIYEEFIEMEVQNSFVSMLSTVTFVKRYSDIYMIRNIKTGELFSEVIDHLPTTNEYEETDIPIIVDEPESYDDILEEIIY